MANGDEGRWWGIYGGGGMVVMGMVCLNCDDDGDESGDEVGIV